MGITCLIITESALFSIFVVAYVFYMGKSLNGPYPSEVLHVPCAGQPRAFWFQRHGRAWRKRFCTHAPGQAS